jgi:hypothetical protein
MVNVFVNLQPRTVFLIDAVGALISVLLLGVILPAFETIVGMPYRVLYLLAGLAGVLFLLSTICFVFAGRKWKLFLVLVALGNIFYCFLTGAAIVWFQSDLTNIGLVYFIAEIAVILSLASLELVYAFRKTTAEF